MRELIVGMVTGRLVLRQHFRAGIFRTHRNLLRRRSGLPYNAGDKTAAQMP
jgi:hypothetical protein